MPASHDYADLILRLTALPSEREWVEFKDSNGDPREIGELLSALSNAARLHSKDRAFLVWGVQDETRSVVGTAFEPSLEKVGKEELENWLCTQLEPRVQFWFRESTVEQKRCVLLEIEPAPHRPVAFKGTEWIRVGSYKKKLREHPEKERALWRAFERASFESTTVSYDLSEEEALEALNWAAYFELIGQGTPTSPGAVAEALEAARLITRSDAGYFDITALGGLAFARDISRFPRLERKALRVVFYRGRDRTEASSEHAGKRGYAAAFSQLIAFLVRQLEREQIHRALRHQQSAYPEIALRELVANALIHQDFDVAGAGPMVEVFDDRIEITSPGAPLIDIARFLDLPPRSRNERLASLMRRLGICEERGSGIDKVLRAVEAAQLPAPDFQDLGTDTRVVLFGPRPIEEMTKAERVRACYQHAGLQWVSSRTMTNESLRARLGLRENQAAMASRIIADTLAAGLVKAQDPLSGSKRHARYVPAWA